MTMADIRDVPVSVQEQVRAAGRGRVPAVCVDQDMTDTWPCLRVELGSDTVRVSISDRWSYARMRAGLTPEMAREAARLLLTAADEVQAEIDRDAAEAAP